MFQGLYTGHSPPYSLAWLQAQGRSCTVRG